MPSVLETFVLLFDADTSRAKAGVREVEQASDKAAKSADSLADSLKKVADDARIGMTTAAEAAKEFSGSVGDQQKALGKLLGQIDPVVSKLANLNSIEQRLLAAKEAGILPIEDFDRYKGKIDQARAEIVKTEKATSRLKNEADRGAEALVGMAKGALGAFAGVLAVGNLIGRAFESVNHSEQIGRISNTLNVAIEDLDAFGKAAEIAGGDAQGAFDSLTDIAEKSGEAMADANSQAAKSFKELGVSLKDGAGQSRNSLDLMLQLADATSKLDRQSAIFQIKQLGVTDNRTIDLILKGRKEIEQLIKTQKDLGVTTKEDVEIAQRYKLALAALNTSYDSVATRVASAFLPALTQVVDWLRSGINWARENSGVLKGAFIGVAAILAAVYLPAMLSAAAATLAATWPILAIGAAVTAAAAAFGLLYDDITTFLDGGDSFIGQVSEKWPIVGEIVKQWAAYLGLLKDVAMAVFGALGDLITQPTKAWDNFTAAVNTAYENFMGKSTLIKSAVSSIGDAFTSLKGFVTATWDAMIASVTRGFDVIMSGVNKIRSLASKVGIGPDPTAPTNPVVPGEGLVNGDVPIAPGLAAGQRQLATIAATPIGAQTSNSITLEGNRGSRDTTVQTGDIIVQTQATDADGIAGAVGDSMTAQLQQAANNFDDGVDR